MSNSSLDGFFALAAIVSPTRPLACYCWTLQQYCAPLAPLGCYPLLLQHGCFRLTLWGVTLALAGNVCSTRYQNRSYQTARNTTPFSGRGLRPRGVRRVACFQHGSCLFVWLAVLFFCFVCLFVRECLVLIAKTHSRRFGEQPALGA